MLFSAEGDSSSLLPGQRAHRDGPGERRHESEQAEPVRGRTGAGHPSQPPGEYTLLNLQMSTHS